MAANNTTSCSDECIISETIKCELELPEYMQEDGAVNQQEHDVGGRFVFDFQSVKCEEQRQELHEQQAIHSSIDTDQWSMWTCDVNEVKAENKASRGEHGRNSDDVKHWVVCPGGEIFIPSLIAGTLAAIGCWCHVVAVFYARISLDNNIASLTKPTPAAKKLQRWLSAPSN